MLWNSTTSAVNEENTSAPDFPAVVLCESTGPIYFDIGANEYYNSIFILVSINMSVWIFSDNPSWNNRVKGHRSKKQWLLVWIVKQKVVFRIVDVLLTPSIDPNLLILLTWHIAKSTDFPVTLNFHSKKKDVFCC